MAAILATAACRRSHGPTTGPYVGVPIDNFAEVAAGVYRGEQPDDAGFAALKKLGVKTIVNFQTKKDDHAAAAPLGLDVVDIPMPTHPYIDPPTDAQVKQFFDVVLDPARRPVFVHCAGGRDRTGTMCALYRMEIDGWTKEKALDEMYAFGFHAHQDDFNGLEAFVKNYKLRGFGAAQTK